MKPPTVAAPPPPSAERQRVLALLEAGKITGEEAAELLTALAQSQTASSTAAALSGPRRIMAVGAAAMLVAFFLPWFTENITKAMSVMQQALPGFAAPGSATITPPQGFGDIPGLNGVPEAGTPTTATVMEEVLRGGDVRNGLGWIALAAAIAAAALPLFWPSRSRDDRMMRNVTLAFLAVGSVVLLYLLSASLNPLTTIEPGFLLATGGYVVLWIGAVREYMPPRARLQAASAGI
jgi:hypothetical protein